MSEIGIDRRRDRPPSERAVAIFARFQRGDTYRQIAMDEGCSHQNIAGIVAGVSHHQKVAMRPKRNGPAVKRIVLPATLVDAWREWRMTLTALALAAGCSVQTAKRALRRQGAEREPRPPRPPNKSWAVYEAFKQGAQTRELAQRFGISMGCVGKMVYDCRLKDPDPYWRQASRRRKEPKPCPTTIPLPPPG